MSNILCIDSCQRERDESHNLRMRVAALVRRSILLPLFLGLGGTSLFFLSIQGNPWNRWISLDSLIQPIPLQIFWVHPHWWRPHRAEREKWTRVASVRYPDLSRSSTWCQSMSLKKLTCGCRTVSLRASCKWISGIMPTKTLHIVFLSGQIATRPISIKSGLWRGFECSRGC